MMARYGRPRLVVYNPDPEPSSAAQTAWDRVPPPPPLDAGRSNPPLSPPSSTSSHRDDSTPPPSTPGLTAQVVDLSDSPSSPEPPQAVPAIEHPHSHPARTTLRSFFRIGHHPSPSEPSKSKGKGPRRPQTSPTVSTPSDTRIHARPPSAGIGEGIFIGVTTDLERFMSVDISGATCADFIKERILSRLQVSDEDQAVTTFTFHKTSFSGHSTGEALTDDQLVQLCREEGDSSGRLHLLVRVDHTQVLERNKLFNALSPNSSTQVPPPPMPIPRPPPAHQLSRQDSVSSASESHPEPNGYEGDVDGEQPTTFRRPRPLPNPVPQPSPASPRDTHRVLPSSSPKVHTRPISPPVVAEHRYGAQGQTGFTTGVPPLSPSRPTFSQNDEPLVLPSIKPLHMRSGSDAATERETMQQQQQQQQQMAGGTDSWNIPHGPLRPRGMSKDGRPKRGISGSDESRPDIRYSDKDRSITQDVTRPFIQPRSQVSNSPVRPKHSSPSIRNISIPHHPSHPPPAVPGTSHDVRPSARGSNQVPSNWAVMWKGGDNKTKNAPVAATPRSDHRMNRYKSEDSLRALARTSNSSHPVTLQPGRKLPMSGNPNSSERVTSNGLPRSYEHRKLLPMHGPVLVEQRQQPSTALLSPSSNDPYIRPNSALGENGTMLPGTAQRTMINARSPVHMYNPTYSPTTNDPYGDKTSRSPGGSPHSPPRSHLELKSDSSGSSSYTPVSGLFSEISRWAGEEGSSTVIASRPSFHDYSATSLASPTSTYMSTESDADLWNVRPSDGTIIPTPTKPRLEVKTSSNLPSEMKQTYTSSKPSPHGSGSPRTSKALMQGTFAENSWAPRPPAEVVYDRLEEFFSGHDLDRPVVESSSGGTSPTNVEPTVVPAPVPERDARARNKKSIRVVAKEHQKRVRNSDASAVAMHRKRSTKLWGSKVEEITPLQAKAAAPDSPTTGASTFKWVRGELIGKGTYGKVYLALNATTGEMIAVKQVELISPHNGANDSKQEAVVQALKMESETLKDLDHPNIVSYLGFEETPQNLSIFLEYVPGGSITSCLHKHGKFDEEVTKSFTGQILLGLEYLHSKGIIHRDLKADNILVETSGVCKISDFGISKRTTDLQASTSLQGTVFWMAPEVVDTRSGGYNSKVDIWSVGCVVLEMWGGRRPWNGEASWAVIFKLYNERQPPPVPEDVILSPLADEFRRKCFAINPSDRPSATELKNHPYLTLSPGWIFTEFR